MVLCKYSKILKSNKYIVYIFQDFLEMPFSKVNTNKCISSKAHKHTHTHTHTNTQTHTHIYTQTHTHSHTYTYTHTHRVTHTHTHTETPLIRSSVVFRRGCVGYNTQRTPTRRDKSCLVAPRGA